MPQGPGDFDASAWQGFGLILTNPVVAKHEAVFQRVLNRVSYAMNALAAVALTVMMLLTVADVILRSMGQSDLRHL